MKNPFERSVALNEFPNLYHCREKLAMDLETVGGRLAVPSPVSDHGPGPSTPPMARTCASYVAPASRPGRVRLVGVAGSSLISVPGLFGSSYL